MQNFRALGAPPHCLWRLGLRPQTPISLRWLGGSAPRTPKQPPHYEFLATHLIAAAWVGPLSLWHKHAIYLSLSMQYDN